MQDADGQDGARQLRTAEEGDALVVAVLRRHGDVVLRVARRHSLCDEDAADASQRALEIFVRHVRRLEEETAHRWLFRVVRNEALSIREQRQRMLGPTELQADLLEARHVESPEDRVLALEATAQAAEALLALKDHELQALVMQASGATMAGIAERSGWTATKVNRAVTEGRRRLRAQRDAIADGRECERWRPALLALLAGEADARAVAAVRPHLRNCGACRAHLRALHRAAAPASRVAAVAPVGLAGLSLEHGRGTGWIARAHDALVTGLHEHVTGRVLQVQTAAEALSAGKVAAVAASAAVLASGGAAVVEGSGSPVLQQGPGHVDRATAAGPATHVVSFRRPVAVEAATGQPAGPAVVRVTGPLRSSAGAGGRAAPLAPASSSPSKVRRPRPEFRVRPAAVVPAEVRAAQVQAATTSPERELESSPPASSASAPREFTPGRSAGGAAGVTASSAVATPRPPGAGAEFAP